MGLVALDLEQWIEPDGRFVEELSEKDRLLTERHGDVVGALPGSEAAQNEVLELLTEHMARRHSGLLRIEGDELTVPPTGVTYRRDEWSGAAIDLAGRLAQEDFCLMAPGPHGYTLEAASLCFPSRWRLAEKLGRPMTIIHEPVPGFADKLARPVDRFFEHLHADRPVWRVNWSVNDDPALFQPVRRQEADTDEAITDANAGERLFVRCERQTLRRLANTGWILFTIKTYVDPISMLREAPEAAAGLAAALRELPEGTRRYKNIAPYQGALLGFLDRVATA
jgi:dimethylamine monooxygenase subunit A